MPGSTVSVTASVNGQSNPSIFFAQFSNPVGNVNTSTVTVTGPGGVTLTGAAFYVPGGGKGPHFTSDDGSVAPAQSVVFVPGNNVKATPDCGKCASTVSGGIPTDELPDGQYEMTLSGLVDSKGRTIPDITIGFSIGTCFTASLTGHTDNPKLPTAKLTATFDASVLLTNWHVTDPSSVTTTLTASPTGSASSFQATYVNATLGTYHVSIAWTNPDGTCASSTTYTFTLSE